MRRLDLTLISRYNIITRIHRSQNYCNRIIRHLSSSHADPSVRENFKTALEKGPNLKDFIVNDNNDVTDLTDATVADNIPYLEGQNFNLKPRKVFFEVYGCQMNVNDTEIVWSILQKAGYEKTTTEKMADVVLLMTCAIREGAESKIWDRLRRLRKVKREKNSQQKQYKIGVLGCMAERLKEKLIEKEQVVDLVAGPDSYKDLPRLLALTENNQTAVNVILSLDETYANVTPVRLNEDSVTAFVSIMRGCDNMCTYCIVPFTRGRERSRPNYSIVDEVKHLSDLGVKEVTLLGQNVNSYRDLSESVERMETSMVKGFKTVYKVKTGGLRFADLLDRVSLVNPNMRVRFTSPHPKDFPDEVLQIIKERPNICKNLHMPAQSGNSAVLERMRRGYTREAYLELVEHIREILPTVSFSGDFICGFCGETEQEFDDTITLMETVQYHVAFLFAYSMRERTTAHRRFKDDVPHDVKIERLTRMAQTYRTGAEILLKKEIGKEHLILIEGRSKKSELMLAGRNDSNIKVIIPIGPIPVYGTDGEKEILPGDYVSVKITDANSQVLKGVPLFHTSITEFYNHNAALPSEKIKQEIC